eukprot:4737285-Pyramimonas_sp.AAC.1
MGSRNAVLGGGAQAGGATGAFGGALYGPTKRCTGWRVACGRTTGAPCRATKRCATSGGTHASGVTGA